ncbi:hypothetical protein ESA94_20430 [Lacibacter luteus]|uniref:Uncharacterized protein n=1 Tax=Lacibacter luteus TaxID=2508719 RepID=A0A4Q1CD99_9BACT|nr:hypothetical protein [Lacibacter luteus]RXK57568.1 hypothetical protein ESA94_20430 [Lacibacter luteus]
MSFSTKECAWAQVSMKLLGANIIGLRSFEFKENLEKELIYAAGKKAIDITMGNESASGTLTLLKFEFDKITDAAQAAGYKNILHVPHPAILLTVAFKLNPQTPIRIIEAPMGIAITDQTLAMAQNAKMMEVPLPWIAQELTLRAGTL